MLMRGRYYVAPESFGNNLDFKALLQRLVHEGAGRPIRRDGGIDGPWTAELLAQEVSEVGRKLGGDVDVRTVQRWLQNGGSGVSAENIRRLAQVFGCGDPNASIKWQAKLGAAQAQLIVNRREIRSSGRPKIPTEQDPIPPVVLRDDSLVRKGLAHRVAAMFEGESSLNLPVTVWAGICTLWFIAYALGVHNITYRLENGVDKQVGLFWAPSWNIGEAIFIPLFLITASDAIAHWKHVGRPTIHGEGGDGNIGWARKLANHEIAYRGILLVSLIAITILQWVGVYLLSFLSDDGSPIMVDWILVSVVRPDEVSTVVALWVSVFAYLYNGYIYWLFLNGAMLLYQIVTDLSETFHLRADASGSPNVRETVDAVQNSIFRGAVYGSVLAICVKLNATYIESDGGNIVNWLVSDALLGLGFRALQGWQWIDGSSPSSFSSVLLLFVVIFVYVKGELQIRKIRADLGLHVTGSRTNSVKAALRPISVALLVVGFAGIGNFYGFSIVMVLTMVIALWGTYFLKSKSAEF